MNVTPEQLQALLQLYRAVDAKYSHDWPGLPPHERAILKAWGETVYQGIVVLASPLENES